MFEHDISSDPISYKIRHAPHICGDDIARAFIGT